MKTILISLALGISFLATGCNSNSSKDPATDSVEQPAPTPSRTDRY